MIQYQVHPLAFLNGKMYPQGNGGRKNTPKQKIRKEVREQEVQTQNQAASAVTEECALGATTDSASTSETAAPILS